MSSISKNKAFVRQVCFLFENKCFLLKKSKDTTDTQCTLILLHIHSHTYMFIDYQTVSIPYNLFISLKSLCGSSLEKSQLFN